MSNKFFYGQQDYITQLNLMDDNYNLFKGSWYGPLASDPTLDPLGNAPTAGDAYFSTSADVLKIYNGTTWQASDINTANLAASTGATLVGTSGGITVQAALNGKEPTITSGATSQYIRGDKSLSTFASDVIASVLTGLSTATNAVITATDTVLSALGKLQKQISDNLTTLTSHTSNVGNPHSTTATQVGLGNCNNTSDANKPVSTAQQALVDSRTGTTGAAGNRNIIINADMMYDQRHEGASFTIAASSSALATDRWLVVNNTNQTVTIQQTSLSNYNGSDIHKCLKLSFGVAPTTGSVLVKQRVRSVDTFASQSVVLSTTVASAETTMTASMYPIQVFGSGGSASVTGSSVSLSLTSTPTRFSGNQTLASIVGKTIGTNHYVEFVHDFSIRSTNALTITDVQFELGTVVTSFATRGKIAELEHCQAYCFKSFPQGTAPAQSAGTAGALTIQSNATSTFSGSFTFPVNMPGPSATVTTYNPSAANANFRDTNNGADRTVNTATAYDSSIHLVGLAGIVNGINRIHILVDNEL